jgi:5-methyltetrahydropteroyltriglutamate--homocysteine methyltransferase
VKWRLIALAGHTGDRQPAFRNATAGAAASTQIHTHLCYSECRDVIDAIDALDADVTTIEAARSRMEVLDDLRCIGFDPSPALG